LIASLFGSEELKLESNKLILTILIIQFVAIGGSYLFAFISSKVGNIRALMISVSVWISVCTMAFFLRAEDPDVEIKFYFLGATVGLIMGGIQSLSRSTYSKMLPPTENTTSFFSFYDVTEKIAIVLGTFIYGILIAITGSMRASSLTLGVFFLAALIILAGVKMKENKKMRYYR
jgi:UMF1 family MFS transporter